MGSRSAGPGDPRGKKRRPANGAPRVVNTAPLSAEAYQITPIMAVWGLPSVPVTRRPNIVTRKSDDGTQSNVVNADVLGQAAELQLGAINMSCGFVIGAGATFAPQGRTIADRAPPLATGALMALLRTHMP